METAVLEPPLLVAACALGDGERVVTDLAELQRLRSAWDAVEQLDPSPMQTFAWSLACAETLVAPGAARVLVSSRFGQPLAVAPLAQVPNSPGRWQQVGVEQLYEPADLVYGDGASLNRLLCGLRKSGHPFVLGRVSVESPTIAAVRQVFARRGIVAIRKQRSYPYIALDESWRQPEQNLSSRRRSDLRRALKRAEEVGEVTSEVVAPDVRELDGLLDRAFEIEARSWKGVAGTALARDKLRAAFFRRYAHEACQAGMLRLAWLRMGDKLVAMQIAVEHRRRLWLLKIGYDEQFARCSPGSLLTARTIQYAAEQELEGYEFLGISSPWTEMWTEQERHFVAIRVYPFTARGLLALAVDGLVAVRQRLQRRAT